MKRIRNSLLALGLAGALFAVPRAEAQVVQLGWNSSMDVLCLNAGCDLMQFTLNLSGLKPTDNNGNPVPAAIVNLNSPGYPTQWTIDIFGGPGTFSSASVVSGPGWISFLTGGSLAVQNNQTGFPYSAAPVVVQAQLSTGGAYNFGYSGLAYLGSAGECYTASGSVVSCTTSGTLYRQGDFNGLGTNVPEPMSMTLLATGLVGMGLVSLRRRKKQQQAE